MIRSSAFWLPQREFGMGGLGEEVGDEGVGEGGEEEEKEVERRRWI
jgi:hypothetical protein